MPLAAAPIVAAIPVLLGLVLLVGLRWPAVRAMPVCGAVTATLALTGWGVGGERVLAALFESVIITLGILLILFGALLLAEQLGAAGALARFQRWIGARSSDRRVQALLVAWSLGSFFEGAAGFGTPAALTAPLLVALGFPALSAVAVALVGDSVAVVFGAVGTPLLVGMDESLARVPASLPWSTLVGARAAAYDIIAGSIMPVLLVLSLTVGARGRQGVRAGLELAPFALAVGLTHTVAAWVTAVVFGPELPSLLGPLAGLLTALALLESGFLVPKVAWRLPTDAAFENTAAPPLVADTPAPSVVDEEPSLLRSAVPYLSLVVLLIVTRLNRLELGAWLRSFELGWRDILGTGLTATIRPLHSPGFLFVIVALLAVPLFKLRLRTLLRSARASGRVTLKASVALLFAVATVRIFVHSDVNTAGLAAMPIVLANVAAGGVGGVWPLLAPWVGALGSFIAGSATFSNMLFAPVQYAVAVASGFDATSVLALQAMGAAAGNMVCIHNVVAATAVVGLAGVEGEVIRRTFPPMLVYLLLVGALGLVVAAL